jgi:DNA replication protein DnaC
LDNRLGDLWSLFDFLASCRFLEEKVCILIVGPCGTGKSHIVQALRHCAVRNGHDVLFTSACRMLGQLHAARAANGFYRQLAKLCSVDSADHR